MRKSIKHYSVIKLSTPVRPPWLCRCTQKKGSEVKLKHIDGRIMVVPFHDEVDRYTLKSALSDAEIEATEFLSAVK